MMATLIRDMQVETVRAGQSRPYADSIYVYVLRFSTDDPKQPWTPPEACVRALAAAFHSRGSERVRLTTDEPMTTEGDFYRPFISSVAVESDGSWRVVIVRRFTD